MPWMRPPMRTPDQDCPPGLEYLCVLDHILINQQIEYFKKMFSIERENNYKVKNKFGLNIYSAIEHSSCCVRSCLGSDRPFQIRIKDYTGREVIRVHRPYRCGASCFCFPFCRQVLKVSAPVNEVIGFVVKEWACCYPSFVIKNANKEAVLRIKGPCCRWDGCCSCRAKFYVLNLDGRVVGKIRKKWPSMVKKTWTDADNFGITFPMDLDVRMKAVLLGACLYIDFIYFETPR